jgi:hypothetical protein
MTLVIESSIITIIGVFTGAPGCSLMRGPISKKYNCNPY